MDLIYLDPPFNSNANYSQLFSTPKGKPSVAQIEAFEDTWHWGESAEAAFQSVRTGGDLPVSTMLTAMRKFLGENDMMAYLSMMAVRLIELHRVLAPTGSLYFHCDPTAGHYLKLLMDAVFGPLSFRNEIVWKRTGSHGNAKRWGPIHDTLLFYTKSSKYTWNRTFEEYDPNYIEKAYKLSDDGGRYQLVSLTGAGVRTGNSGQPWKGVDPTAIGRHWAIPRRSLERAYPDKDLDDLGTQQCLDLLEEAGLIYWPAKGNVPRQKRYLSEGQGEPIQSVITDIPPLSSIDAERLGYPT